MKKKIKTNKSCPQIKHQHHCRKFIGTVDGVGICVECGKTVVWNKERALKVATRKLEVIK